MTQLYSAEVAASFKGGRSWRLRWRRRFNVSIRKKNNVKNTTWEETAPVLAHYFQNLRRRLRGEPMLGTPKEHEVRAEEPSRDAQADETDEAELDDIDYADEDTDVPPAPRTPPDGFKLAATPPTADQLAYKSAAASELVGKSILFHWLVVGWLVGTIQRSNTDGRHKIDGEPVNFFVYYEQDDDESKHVLDLETHGSLAEGHGWALLEAVDASAQAVEVLVRSAAEEAAAEAAAAAVAAEAEAAAAAAAQASEAAEAAAGEAASAAAALAGEPQVPQVPPPVASEAEAGRATVRTAMRETAAAETAAGGATMPQGSGGEGAPVESGVKRKWGAYPPHRRANVDQIPLPFINGMDTTYEETGAKRVAINQLCPTLSKRMATGQVVVRAEKPPPPEGADDEALARYRQELMEQPPPCLIFRGTGARIAQAELDAYPPELVVLWQPCAERVPTWTEAARPHFSFVSLASL